MLLEKELVQQRVDAQQSIAGEPNGRVVDLQHTFRGQVIELASKPC